MFPGSLLIKAGKCIGTTKGYTLVLGKRTLLAMLVQPPHARKGERAAIFWARKQHKHRNKQEKKLEDGLDMHPQYWWGECCEIQTGQSQTETFFYTNSGSDRQQVFIY